MRAQGVGAQEKVVCHRVGRGRDVEPLFLLGREFDPECVCDLLRDLALDTEDIAVLRR